MQSKFCLLFFFQKLQNLLFLSKRVGNIWSECQNSLDPRWSPTFCGASSGSKLFAKVKTATRVRYVQTRVNNWIFELHFPQSWLVVLSWTYLFYSWNIIYRQFFQGTLQLLVICCCSSVYNLLLSSGCSLKYSKHSYRQSTR